jgi:hypothetical protein
VKLNTSTGIKVLKPDNGTGNAFLIDLNFAINIMVSISNNTLKGKITNYVFELVLREKELKDVTIDDVNILFNALFKLVLPQINTLLNDGIKIPPVPFFDLSKCTMTLKPRYLFLDIEPEPVKKDFEKHINFAFHKLAGAYKKFSAVSKLRKEKPASMPEWIKVEL